MRSRKPLKDALLNPNVQAFLMVIRTGEGTKDEGGYTRLYGGGQFTDLSQHPRRHVHANGRWSTAAGAYQIKEATWDGLVAQYGFTDFSRETQDEAAVALLIRRKALPDVRGGLLATAVRKCNKEWASLPDSPYGQPTITYATARKVFAQYGGKRPYES